MSRVIWLVLDSLGVGAVVVTLLTAAANSATAAPAPEPASNWARTAMRVTHAAGPGAWWRSGLPQP